jgi:large subunit ribosomal protein L5
MDNPMRSISVEKVTLNIGVGEPGEKLEKISKLLNSISGTKVVNTITNKRIPDWNIRPGLAIGVKTTIRGAKTDELLKRLFQGVENKIPKQKFDDKGNLSFGISEYVHIPGVRYDYSVGIVGLSVAVTLWRRGFSMARKRVKARIGKSHLITREEAMQFIKDKYEVEII